MKLGAKKLFKGPQVMGPTQGVSSVYCSVMRPPVR
jgi:hypothetical protein